MKKTVISIVGFFGVCLMFVACGQNNGGGGAAAPVATPQACSTAGQVNTQYGCTATCPGNPSMGYYNNQCVPVTTTGYGTGGNCVGQVGYVYAGNSCYQECGAGMAMINGSCISVAYYNSYYSSYYSSNGNGYYPPAYPTTTYNYPVVYPYYSYPTYGYGAGYGYGGGYGYGNRNSLSIGVGLNLGL